MNNYKNGNPMEPLRRTHLVTSVACVLALSVAAGAQANAPSHHGMGNDNHVVSAGQLVMPSTMAVSEPEANPFAAQDELIRAIASGELDAEVESFLMERAAMRAAEPAQTLSPTATHIVTNCSNNGPGSLRDKISIAASGDVVDLSQLTCGTITLTSQLLVAQDSLHLMGQLPESKYLGSPLIQAAAANTSGLITHTGEGTLSLENLTLTNSKKQHVLPAAPSGGCVDSKGSLKLNEMTITSCSVTTTADFETRGGALFASKNIDIDRSRISDSKAIASLGGARGGGVFAWGRLRMTASSITGNEVISSGYASGGGIEATGGGSIERSTISANKADSIAGLNLSSSDGASVWLKHVTLSGNISEGDYVASAARFWTSGNVYIGNSTITNNTGGMLAAALSVQHRDTTQVTLVSNLVSGNRSIGPGYVEQLDVLSNSPLSGSNNLIGVARNDSVALPPDTIRQQESPLGPLRDNGGRTQTHAPLRGSWAFNSGIFQPAIIGFTPIPGLPGPGTPIFEPSHDQTGAARTVGTGTDIGAFESDALFVDGFNKKTTF